MTPEQKQVAGREACRRYRERKRQGLIARGEYKPPRAKRTHCPAGHPYDEENTYVDPNSGWRRCRVCHNEQVKAIYAADPEAGRQYARDMYEKHGEEWNRQDREQRAADPERFREQERARYRDDPEPKRWHIYRRRHQLAPGEWEALWEQQKGLCYLCGDVLRMPPGGLRETPGSGGGIPHLDHDHRCCPKSRSCSICRRGISCGRCNCSIGMAGDDPARLRRMADALEAAQAIVEERMAAAAGKGVS